jgi:hypothetical protein
MVIENETYTINNDDGKASCGCGPVLGPFRSDDISVQADHHRLCIIQITNLPKLLTSR